jgi:hypothetical protein
MSTSCKQYNAHSFSPNALCLQRCIKPNSWAGCYPTRALRLSAEKYMPRNKDLADTFRVLHSHNTGCSNGFIGGKKPSEPARGHSTRMQTNVSIVQNGYNKMKNKASKHHTQQAVAHTQAVLGHDRGSVVIYTLTLSIALLQTVRYIKVHTLRKHRRCRHKRTG